MGARGRAPSQKGGRSAASSRGKQKRSMPQTKFSAKRMGDEDLTDESEDDDESEQDSSHSDEESDEDEGLGDEKPKTHYSLLVEAINKKTKRKRENPHIDFGGTRSGLSQATKSLRHNIEEEQSRADKAQKARSEEHTEESKRIKRPKRNDSRANEKVDAIRKNDEHEPVLNEASGEHFNIGGTINPETVHTNPLAVNLSRDPKLISHVSAELDDDGRDSMERDIWEDTKAKEEDETGDDVSDGGELVEGLRQDPFHNHYSEPDEKDVAKKILAIKNSKWDMVRVATKLSKNVVVMPDVDGSSATANISFPPPVLDASTLNLKKRLQNGLGDSWEEGFDEEEQSFASLLFNYHDMLYCKRTHVNAPKLRKLLCLHALNHCLKTRDRVLKNNAKVSEAKKLKEEVDDEETEGDFQDQGFTRPKVLFLLPTREACARTVHTLIHLLAGMGQEHRKRFEEEFVDKEQKFGHGSDKPASFLDLFGGNDDDNFRIGIKLTRTTIKLYSKFYASEILLASPLGLRMAMEGDKKKGKEPDHEYLSSIEVVVVDQADALLMQNWEHVEHIFKHLNLMPDSKNDWEIGRVRPWYLEGQAQYYRQTVILSQFQTPELAELQRVHCLNWEGKVKVLPPSYSGEITKIPVKLRQTFTRFESKNVAGDPDARFRYFCATVVPTLARKGKKNTGGGGTLLFVPSYIDFVRVRNYFANSSAAANVSFGSISEYTDVRETSRAMSHFRTGRYSVLLYTERAHHFRRSVLRGVQRVVFYAPPDNPAFYGEVVGFLAKSRLDGTLDVERDDGGEKGSVRVIFSRYDVMKLERVVGTSRVGRMAGDRGDVFDFL
ncbi:hypothetical protein MKZ38_010238 [Zalerion maritima]|uniref:U3 small nucleolar RNA-associated protein 25 n=1 Tax=Zalerion maritima TaxID=339359 RepID=A0AAD5RU41_9PEZI|nr:hypothetical protein MKZ38_010238 [Zalerion maritima]